MFWWIFLNPIFFREEAFTFQELFLTLQEIVDLILATNLMESLLVYLSDLVEKYPKQFKLLFPTLSIRPKMHLLIHYESILRKNGPSRNYWCMNFERMNGSVKIPAHIMQNFRDLQQTLAYMRQCAALNSFLDGKHNRDFVSATRTSVATISGINSADNFNDFQSYFESVHFAVANKIIINAIEYRNGTFIILSSDDDLNPYTFAEIVFAVCENLDDIALNVTVYRTK